jgi:hypothetical protein
MRFLSRLFGKRRRAITRRERFAAHFMRAIIAKSPYQQMTSIESRERFEAHARGAVGYADALIAQLDRK